MKKFYTAFLYRPTSTNPHCTHKYLGEQDIDRFLAITETITIFDPTTLRMPVVVFDKEETFGTPEDPKRVLTTPNRGAFERFDLLRRLLDFFNEDGFKFNPHVTTITENKIDLPFTHYAICTGRTVIFAWPLMASI